MTLAKITRGIMRPLLKGTIMFASLLRPKLTPKNIAVAATYVAAAVGILMVRARLENLRNENTPAE